MSNFRSLFAVHTIVIFSLVLLHFALPVSANACMDCGPAYYRTMYAAMPSNWLNAGYQVGDVVFKSIPAGKYYVIPAHDYILGDPEPSCCVWGPWFVGSNGTLFYVW